MAPKTLFSNPITLFKLFGFAVRIDASWIFIALLVVWALAAGFFPHRQPDLSQETYWLMGVIGALGLFASIIFHELWHSLVARRFDLPMTGIIDSVNKYLNFAYNVVCCEYEYYRCPQTQSASPV
ncbi:hypothetical protein [Geoalkalibacter halelectricus]|uniref:hypothetical protein n=1 Tax=Geoalkalibacter halelectricus TaxID=2847045 RepID=UPI003D25BB0F